jgi:hypothetical protein
MAIRGRMILSKTNSDMDPPPLSRRSRINAARLDSVDGQCGWTVCNGFMGGVACEDVWRRIYGGAV